MRLCIKLLFFVVTIVFVGCAAVSQEIIPQKPAQKTAPKQAPAPKPDPVPVPQEPISEPPPEKPRESVEPTTIGAILPLSGNFAAYGQRALIALKMGLGTTEQMPSGSSIKIFSGPDAKLIVADSAADVETAKQAVRTLVHDYNVVAILGDILTDSSLAVATEAANLNVPTVSLSRKEALTSVGSMIFQVSLTTKMQANALVKKAIGEKKLTRFAILYPKHSYGTEMTSSLTEEIKLQGGELVAVESYEPNETTFTAHVRKLIRREKPDSEPQIPFDVLVLPDFPKAVRYIVPELIAQDFLLTSDERQIRSYRRATGFENVRPVLLMGPNSWNQDDLAPKLGNAVNGAMFLDGVNLREERPAIVKFKGEFQNAAGSTPTLIDAQIYDAAQMVRSVLRQPTSWLLRERKEFADKMRSIKKFVGVTGEISLNQNGEYQMPIHWFTFSNGQVAWQS